jgi:peroxiredoxin/dTDP-4-amino-4,6-dideoxygalactose transaminase
MKGGFLSAWAPPDPRALLRRPAPTLPFPLEEPDCRLLEWARHGLYLGLRATTIGPGDEILVPAYNHGSELTVLETLGIAPRFYDATDDLEPDPDELESLLGPKTRALYLIHHLGFGLDAARWRTWCDERGLLLIEDVAMAWLAERDGRPLGSLGDIAIFSPWKTFGLADGGAVLTRGLAIDQPPLRRGVLPKRLLEGFARGAAHRQGWIADAGRRRGGDRADVAEVEWGLGDVLSGPYASSLALLRRSITVDAAAARRANHGRLLDALGQFVPTPFDRVADGTCPFGFPLDVPNRAAFAAAMRTERIDVVNLWSEAHPLVPVDRYPAAAARRAATVLLPVHQGLTTDDIDRIAATTLRTIGKEHSLNTGDRAPEFALRDQDGETVSLANFRGKRVVLYFYPEADTPGCTAQACGIRDHQADLAARDAVALGISPDSPEKLRAFADSHRLPFTLISDVGGRVAREYGVWKRRRRPPFQGEAQRTTFVIGHDGEILRVLPAVDPTTHDQLVLQVLDETA